jgi:hypothetical protein
MGNLRKEFKEGEKVILDIKHANSSLVTVVSQTSGKLYTTVTNGKSVWDVMTIRLTPSVETF